MKRRCLPARSAHCASRVAPTPAAFLASAHAAGGPTRGPGLAARIRRRRAVVRAGHPGCSPRSAPVASQETLVVGVPCVTAAAFFALDLSSLLAVASEDHDLQACP